MPNPFPSSIEETAATTFPLYRADDETSAIWTTTPLGADERIAQFRTVGDVRTFHDRSELDAFVAELSAAIVDGGDPIYEDAEFLASIGIALPAGPCHDPADFPLTPAFHPATVAAREALAGRGVPLRPGIWTPVLSAPGVVTIHPPIALTEAQSGEAVERLKADFPRSRVRTVRDGGFTLFVLFAGDAS